MDLLNYLNRFNEIKIYKSNDEKSYFINLMYTSNPIKVDYNEGIKNLFEKWKAANRFPDDLIIENICFLQN